MLKYKIQKLKRQHYYNYKVTFMFCSYILLNKEVWQEA